MAFLIDVARQFLCTGKRTKVLSRTVCLDLAAQLLATDIGLKPAVLYDINGASPEQVGNYLNALQENNFVSSALHIVALAGTTLIVNIKQMVAHLHDLLLEERLVVIDVCPSLVQPALSDMKGSGTEDAVKVMLEYFTTKSASQERSLIMEISEDIMQDWNLCTVFGVLLGYPATYWFDQDKSFENCLNLVPLLVTKVSLTWLSGVERHNFNLFSFSIPEMLFTHAETLFECWTQTLQQQLKRQTVFTDLNIIKTTVTLPIVAL
ncbi:UPF0739 protein C1orf74 homolog [Engraulis encrasicolus]|uniref:UPF0739 protein C1orf74 homolog n=1 Tax=Engraulis encrasicolus TaxID=184585 RepID=UPI002FD7618C